MSEASSTRLDARSALILVENLSVPFDRRVWAECQTLRRAGCAVTVICPQGTDRDTDAYEQRDGVVIHRYRGRTARGGARGYLAEYAVALLRTRKLVRELSRAQRFDVVHAASPPDFLLLAALPLRRRGARFVFDHHDLSPELYLSRYRRANGIVYRALLAAERLAFRLADVVIATNESYRAIAMRRGHKASDDVFVVRNGPDLARFVAGQPDSKLKRGKPYLLAYVGMMGPQDGVDYALRALAELKRRRSDWHAIFVGGGEILGEMQQLARELDIHDVVEFTGLADVDLVKEVLSTADICLAPEPRNPLNDSSTMVKVAEYLTMGRPVVAFDLTETRETAQDAALYATPNNVDEFAGNILTLLRDSSLRAALSRRALRRAPALAWEHSAPQLLNAYARALTKRQRHASVEKLDMGHTLPS